MTLLHPAILVAAVASLGHPGPPTIERHFHYPASSVAVRWVSDTASVSFANGFAEAAPGAPDLPVLAERVELPAGTRIKSARARRLGWSSIAASARIRSLPGTPSTSEAPVVELGYQGSMRGKNMAWLLVRPVRWSRGTGRLERLADLDVDLELEPDRSEVVSRERIVPEWEDAASGTASIPKGTAQPFKPTQIPSLLGSPVAYVIVTSDALAPQFQRLADWKTQSGVPAVVRTLTTIRAEYAGTDDADRIRRFLRDAYARWGTKWVLLGGDTHVIPTRIAWTTFYVQPPQTLNDIATDLYYSCLDGNWNADGDSLYGEGDLQNSIVDGADLLPEVWVGRASVGTLAEAQQFVDKTFQYTRTPVGNYEKNILFFAEVMEPEDWTPGDFINLDGAQLIEECLPFVKANPSMRYGRLYENYTEPSYEPGSLRLLRRRLIDSLDTGYNLAVHSGHGFRNVMSAGDSSLTIADAQALTNGNKLTNFYAIDCTSNAIDFPCIGEALMKAPNGGAVTNVGSTRLDFPGTARVYQQEYFKLLFRDSVTAVGEAQGRQKLPFVAGSKIDFTHRWTQMSLLLLGDPELRIWTGKPRTLTVTKPASMAASDTVFPVHVEIAGAPLYKARVTAYKTGDDYVSVLTDGAGNASLDFRPDGAGSMTLTVTGYDCVPWQQTIPVTASTASLLVEGATTIDDDALGGTLGNGDGVLDAGEIVDLSIPIKNNGSLSASLVNAVLSTANSAVTMMTPTLSYGTIGAGLTATPAGRFRFQTSYTAADQIELAFELSITDGAAHHWKEPVRLTLHSPEPRSYGHTVLETVGDGDGRPEAGETVTYTVSVRNSGSGVARAVTAILRRRDGASSVSDSTSTLGNIAPGATVSGDPFTFSVTSDTARFELRMSTSQGLLATQAIDLRWPASPVNVSARGLATGVNLAWTAGETDLAGYFLYRGTSAAGPFTKLNPVPSDRTSYMVDEGLASLTRYFYRVTAMDSSGNESALSAVVSASTSPPSHGVFPLAMDAATSSIVTAARLTGSTADLIAGANQRLYVWHADGTGPVDADGSPLTPGDFSSAGTQFTAGGSVADLDGGALEVVAATVADQKVYVFDLQGQVKAGWPFSAGTGIFSTPAIGDLDKNGTKEIVVGSNDTRLFALRSNGTEWIDGDANPGTQGVFKLLSANFNFGTPALADIDGDGFLDIVFSSYDGNLYAWNRNGASLPGFPVPLGGQSNSSVAIGFLDGAGDTQPEIVVAGGNQLRVVSGAGVTRAGFPQPLVTGGGYLKEPSPALADIDGDGFTDIVMASQDGRLYVYNRDGSLQPAFTNVRFSGLTQAATESSPVVADINGDGFPDIVIGDDNATLSAFDRNGLLLPGFPVALGGEVKGTPALCDCDGDGMTEIAVAANDGNMYVWDYDFPFSPGKTPPWPQFHHDAMHTGFASTQTSVAVPQEMKPARLSLSPPHPNPARSAASFVVEIPDASAGRRMALDVFDLSGRRIHRLAEGKAEAGRFTLAWDLRDGRGAPVRSGVYLLVLDVGGERHSRRVVAMP